MNEGDVLLTPMPQADGRVKNRPVIFLRAMPPFGDALICGISTQLHQLHPGFDELIDSTDDDFADSGLVSPSLIRLGYLAVLPRKSIIGSIGVISQKRHRRLLQKLAEYLFDSLR
jgi:mRNA interferase MazF